MLPPGVNYVWLLIFDIWIYKNYGTSLTSYTVANHRDADVRTDLSDLSTLKLFSFF